MNTDTFGCDKIDLFKTRIFKNGNWSEPWLLQISQQFQSKVKGSFLAQLHGKSRLEDLIDG